MAPNDGDGGLNGDSGDIRYGLQTRPNNAACVAGPAPTPGNSTLSSEIVFNGVTGLSGFFTDLQRAPSTFKGWVFAAQSGALSYLPDGAAKAELLVDLSTLDDFESGGEKGLLGLAIDPAYPSESAPNRMRLYVSYTGNSRSYISRFDAVMEQPGSNVVRVDAEEVLISVHQPYGNHNGGSLRFGKDGLLYAGFGDGGGGGDPHCNGQNLGTLLGKLLRIDVHSVSTGYTIPIANTFALTAESTPAPFCDDLEGNTPTRGQPDTSRTIPCPEIFAWGLRNPYRISIDRVGQEIWIGDVGQNKVEEVNSISPDATTSRELDSSTHNFGWPLFEGPDTFSSSACRVLLNSATRPSITVAPPVYYYYQANTSRRGVTLGAVYRGSALGGDFSGRLVFTDFVSSEMWAERSPYDALRPTPVDNSAIGEFFPIYGVVQDDEGELYLLNGSTIRRLVLSGDSGRRLPQKLSDTGCVDPTNAKTPATGLIPYTINSRLWTDGAIKTRYIALKNGTQIDRTGGCTPGDPDPCLVDGDWNFPIGTVFLKYFEFGDKMVETRLFMRHDNGQWGGYSYIWDDTQNDATLIDNSTTYNGWTAPSRGQCLSCHTAATGFVVGPTTRQMNTTLLYRSGIVANQLETLDHIGLFEQALATRATDLPSMPDPLSNEGTLEERARAYLHGGCAYCHQPGAHGPTMNALYSATFAETNICNVSAQTEGKTMLVPGSAGDSYISQRLHAVGNGSPSQMPPSPYGRSTVDTRGVGVVDEWINSLSACP